MNLKNKITVYTTHCPQCEVLEYMLKNSGIPYDVVDDEEEVRAEGRKAKIMSAPFCKLENGDVLTCLETFAYISSL